MVKLSTISLAVICALPSLATAASCTNGLYYCGYNLVKKGTLPTKPVPFSPPGSVAVVVSYFSPGGTNVSFVVPRGLRGRNVRREQAGWRTDG
jgi:hypothetical protein